VRDKLFTKKYCILSSIFAGLASYNLGRVVKLMDPDNPCLNKLHRPGPDTTALHVLLHTYVDVYGRKRGKGERVYNDDEDGLLCEMLEDIRLQLANDSLFLLDGRRCTSRPSWWRQREGGSVMRGEQWTLVADQGGLEILSATYVGQRLDRINNSLNAY
jgi:hypothetical protein